MIRTSVLSCMIFGVLGAFSLPSHAVKPFVATCGDGARVKVADSKYPYGIAEACLRAGHQPPSKTRPTARSGVPAEFKNRASADLKVFRKGELQRMVAKSTGAKPASVDHSDIILMLQGCECISPSCVAYSCPADVDIP